MFGITASAGGVASLYDFTTQTFTSAGISGRLPPTLAQVKTAYGNTGWVTDTAFFNMITAGYQLWTVPATANYKIECWGARGSNGGTTYAGGYGAMMSGDFALTSGDKLKLVVGQTGGASYGGGGGMSAVATDLNSPLCVAGGGNSQSPWSTVVRHASTGTSGTDGSVGGYAGTAGAGGTSGIYFSGGAGFLSGPTGATSAGTLPLSFISGSTGGINQCSNSIGSFGGGSASDGCNWGVSGAGGGYSGGGGCNGGSQYGGAGGSYNIGTNQLNYAGNVGTANLSYNGQIKITLL